MSSYSGSGDLPSDLMEYISENSQTYYDAYESIEALQELLKFPLQGRSQLGKSISKYNGATRVDITKVAEPRIVRSPVKFLTVLKLLQTEANIMPSYGLRVKKGSRDDYIHFILDLTANASVGVFFYDSKRLLSVPQVHNVERLVKSAGLKGAIIIANNIGIPAKQEAKRINKEHGGFGIITIEHYDSMKKRLYQEY